RGPPRGGAWSGRGGRGARGAPAARPLAHGPAGIRDVRARRALGDHGRRHRQRRRERPAAQARLVRHRRRRRPHPAIRGHDRRLGAAHHGDRWACLGDPRTRVLDLDRTGAATLTRAERWLLVIPLLGGATFGLLPYLVGG